MPDVQEQRSVGSYLDLVRDARRAWKLFWDGRVPLATKVVPLLAAAYVITPIDVLPDVALGLGQLDDLAVVVLALKVFVALADPARRGESAEGAAPDDPFGVDDPGKVIDGSSRPADERGDGPGSTARSTKRLI